MSKLTKLKNEVVALRNKEKMKRLIITLLIMLFLVGGCAVVPNELHLYGERTEMGKLGTAPTFGVGVTYYLREKK